MDWAARVETLAATADACARVVAAIPEPDAPGLGIWSCAQLAGHLARAMTTLRRYVANASTQPPTLPDAAGYLMAYLDERSRDPAAMDQAVAQRTIEEAATRGPDDAATELRSGAEWARRELRAMEAAATVPTRFGALSLDEYSRTRLLELVVHGFDLAAATGTPFDPPRNALEDTLAVLSEIAIRSGHAPQLIHALTGRVPVLPAVLR